MTSGRFANSCSCTMWDNSDLILYAAVTATIISSVTFKLPSNCYVWNYVSQYTGLSFMTFKFQNFN